MQELWPLPSVRPTDSSASASHWTVATPAVVPNLASTATPGSDLAALPNFYHGADMMDLPGLQTLVSDLIATAKRPVVWWSFSEPSKVLLIALQRMAQSDTDSMNKLLAIYNALPPQGENPMDMKAKMTEAGVPEEHHAAMQACDDACQANGQIILFLIGLFQTFGPAILALYPQLMAILSSADPWPTKVLNVFTLISTLIPKPVPTPA